MNEDQLTMTFERVAGGLEPDVASLVAGGTARGRRRRHRRRLAGCAVLAGCLGAGTVAGIALGGDASRPAGPDPSADVPRAVAVAPQDMSGTLATLLPGARAVEVDEPFQFQVQRGAVRWRGVAVRVVVDARSVATGSTARGRCEAFLGMPCRSAPDGGWIAESGRLAVSDSSTGREVYSDVVALYTRDGYLIEAEGERGDAAAEGEGWSDADEEVLEQVVLSDVWLD